MAEDGSVGPPVQPGDVTEAPSGVSETPAVVPESVAENTNVSTVDEAVADPPASKPPMATGEDGAMEMNEASFSNIEAVEDAAEAESGQRPAVPEVEETDRVMADGEGEPVGVPSVSVEGNDDGRKDVPVSGEEDIPSLAEMEGTHAPAEETGASVDVPGDGGERGEDLIGKEDQALEGGEIEDTDATVKGVPAPVGPDAVSPKDGVTSEDNKVEAETTSKDAIAVESSVEGAKESEDLVSKDEAIAVASVDAVAMKDDLPSNSEVPAANAEVPKEVDTSKEVAPTDDVASKEDVVVEVAPVTPTALESSGPMMEEPMKGGLMAQSAAAAMDNVQVFEPHESQKLENVMRKWKSTSTKGMNKWKAAALKSVSLYSALNRSPAERSTADVNAILKILGTQQILTKKNLDTDTKKSMCRMVGFETFQPGENIVTEGELGDKFYMILSGVVDVLVTAAGRDPVTALKAGTGFGDNALQDEVPKPRNATCRAQTACELLTLCKEDYDKCLKLGSHYKQLFEKWGYPSLDVRWDYIKVLLQCRQLGPQGGVALAVALETAPRVNEVEITGNFIGPEGGVAFGRALKVNHTIAILNLSGNDLGNKGCVAIGEALKANAVVQRLNLSANKCGDEGAHAIAKGLEENQTIIAIDLSRNRITDLGACHLAEHLVDNTTLLKLALENNRITAKGMEILETMQSNNTSLGINGKRYKTVSYPYF